MATPDMLIDFPDLDEVIAEYRYGDFLDNRDFHSVVTIQFGELVHDGLVDWNDPMWQWDRYSDEQYERLNAKIERHFWYREIGSLPLKRWNNEFIRKMNEIMPKYKIMYDILAKDPDWLLAYHAWGTHNQDTFDKDVKTTSTLDTDGKTDDWGKSRDMESEFPQTMLSGNSDYASDGRDREYEDLGTSTEKKVGSGTEKEGYQYNDDESKSQDLDYKYEDFREGDYLQKYYDIMDRWRDVDLLIIGELDCLFSHLLTVNFNMF